MEKPVILKNERGKQLVGILHLPVGKRKPPLVIICHGFEGTKTSRKYVRLARALERNKITSFRFDFEGCGDSEGDFEEITVKKEVSDLAYAIRYALKQKNINKKRIAFVGISLGCVISALYVAQNNFPAKTLVFWAPAFNQGKLFLNWNTKKELRKWRKQGYLIRKESKIGINYLKENEKKDYSLILSKIKIPILIIHGKKDDIVPLKFSKKLVKEYKNIRLVILPKADHRFEDYFIQQELIKKTVSWLKKYL